MVGEDTGFEHDVSMFERVPTESLHVQCSVHIDLAITMSEGVIQLPLQLHPVLPQISVHHFDSLLDTFQAVVWECCHNIFGPWVGAGATEEAFVGLHECGDVGSSDDWAAHGAQHWHLLFFLHDGEG